MANSGYCFTAGLMAACLFPGSYVCDAELPATDLWTERSVAGWGAAADSEGCFEVRSNSAQLVGQRAIEFEVKPGGNPATVTLDMGAAWDVRDADQLVFAWRVMTGSLPSAPTITLWAKNEIGEGYSRYRGLSIKGQWSHSRLDLTAPDEQDAQYGLASRRAVQRIDITFPASDNVFHVLLDDLHFETSFALIQERSRALGPLTERIRPERYAAFLCGSHLDNKPQAHRRLQEMYAPLGEPPESPHREWGTPLAGGPLRALFVVNLAFQREVIELAQRFELDYDFVPLALVQRYQPEMMADIARNRYDVIVTSALRPDDQMASFTGWLSAQVRQGTGWVAINSGGLCGDIELPFAGIDGEIPVVDRWQKVSDHPIIDGVPVALFPPFESRMLEERSEHGNPILRGVEGGAKLMASEAGNGRIVNLASGYGNSGFCIIPRPLGGEHVLHHFPYWEYEYALLANAMLWAANRDPGATVRVTGPTQFSRGVSGSEIVVTVETATPVEGTVAFNLWRTDGANVYEETRNVVVGPDKPGALRIALPGNLCGADHVLDAVFRDGEGRVIDWHSAKIAVEGEIAVAGIELDRKSHHERGEPLALGVTVSNGGVAREGSLRLCIIDTFDRIVHYETLPAALPGGSTIFEHSIQLDPDRFLTEVHWLKAMVFDADGLAATGFRRLYTPLAPEEKHKTWWAGGSAGGTHLHPHIYRHMAGVIRDMHLRAILTNGGYQHDQAELVLDNDLWVTPENIITLGHWLQRFPDGVRKPCLSDPAFLDRDIEEVTFDFASRFSKFQPLGYATAEETSLSVSSPNGTVCLGPHCRRAFGLWLQQMYPDLEALNRQWDTDFATWDRVEGLRWEDGAKDLENPSRWIDFRMFMEEVVATVQGRFGRAIHRADPGAFSGFNCSPYGVNPFHGWNRPLLGKHANFAVEYQPSWLEDRRISTSMELLADSSPHMRLSYWLGYNYMDLEPGRYWYKTWWMAFRQMYGPMFYTLSNDASTIAHYSYVKMHPSLAFNEFSVLGRDVVGSLTHGIGKLLQSFERQATIGVYFSRASMMRTYYEQQRNPVESSVWDVRKHLREEHYDYRRVVRHQLESNHADQFEVLMLTDAVALSDEEWDLLEQYVAPGGTVMAFARTGVADGHGKLRANHDRAAKLFGIRYGDVEAKWKTESVGGLEMAGAIGEVRTPGPVAVEGGTVSGTFSDGSAAVVVNRIGEGSAIFCNFSAQMENTAENRRLIAGLVAPAGDLRSFKVMGDGGVSGGFQSFRYAHGPVEFIGLLHNLGSPVAAGAPLALRSRTKAHTYDVLTGDYAGEVDEVNFAAPRRGHPRLFARLAYPVDGISLTCSDTAGPGESVTYRVAMETPGNTTPGRHVIGIEVTDPEGRKVEVLTKNCIAHHGAYEGVIPFAWNDGPGDWTITARDVISGKTASRTIALQGNPAPIARSN